MTATEHEWIPHEPAADVERTILELYPQGASQKAIAERCGVSERVVRKRLNYLARQGRITKRSRKEALDLRWGSVSEETRREISETMRRAAALGRAGKFQGSEHRG